MSREVHVRFWERVGVKFPRATRLPLYRQGKIYAREGIDLDRSTLADWVGKTTALLEPLADAIGRHVLQGQAIFADDTPVKMLRPRHGQDQDRARPGFMCAMSGRGRARPRRRPSIASPATGAARTRKPIWPASKAGCTPTAMPALKSSIRSGAITEVACMAHIRRKFVDVHKSQGSVVAEQAITRIARLYAIEQEARGQPPDKRVGLRRTQAAPSDRRS